MQATRRIPQQATKCPAAGATFLGRSPSWCSRILISWTYSRKTLFTRVFETRLSTFYTTHTKSAPDPATDLQPITVDVYERSRYRSCSTVMFQSPFLLSQLVPHREQWFRKTINVTETNAHPQAKCHSCPV